MDKMLIKGIRGDEGDYIVAQRITPNGLRDTNLGDVDVKHCYGYVSDNCGTYVLNIGDELFVVQSIDLDFGEGE